ncbi:MAG: hypothetical protein EZS28_036629 [Streblomastix strix]|uniref:Uncharacterized protein n=1 Tax=Streblomastix strix TaxID=222440 RepID=A0A5J4UCF0_9EUKA|nr:MAG: hypothetical protein EZS28_036629 [Streblomastix strix]
MDELMQFLKLHSMQNMKKHNQNVMLMRAFKDNYLQRNSLFFQENTGFFSSLKNFDSKILTRAKKAASWLSPTLHKVMGALSGPVSIIHPGIGVVMGTVGNIAGKVDSYLNKQ